MLLVVLCWLVDDDDEGYYYTTTTTLMSVPGESRFVRIKAVSKHFPLSLRRSLYSSRCSGISSRSSSSFFISITSGAGHSPVGIANTILLRRLVARELLLLLLFP